MWPRLLEKRVRVFDAIDLVRFSAMMADEGFGYACFLDGDGNAADDDKFCIDLETVMSVLDEDNNPSEV